MIRLWVVNLWWATGAEQVRVFGDRREAVSLYRHARDKSDGQCRPYLWEL